jgi:hypothetical protein
MQRVLQTRAQRTVRRRLARRREPALGITAWVAGVEAKVPRLMGRVGRVGLPSTPNAIDRFFRAFERFYNTRQGLHAVLSAKRALLLFLIVYLCTQYAPTGQAPIEVIVPEARRGAPLARDQRPLPGAPGAGSCQTRGPPRRFAPRSGDRRLDPRRRSQATLTA